MTVAPTAQISSSARTTTTTKPGQRPILACTDLTKSYRLTGETVEAVRGVTLEVMPGEFIALMGPSGSGKSTLLQLLGGLDRPTSGEVELEGQSIGQLSDDEATRLRREHTGFVFQSFNLVPLLNVVENVGLPFTIAGQDPRQRPPRRPCPRRHRPRRAVGQGTAQARPAVRWRAATGGGRPRDRDRPAPAVRRRANRQPRLHDRPDILDALWRTCVDRGQTIMLVTHDAKTAAYADRVLVIGDGVIREEIVARVAATTTRPLR